MGGTDGNMPQQGIALSLVDWSGLVERLGHGTGAGLGGRRRGAQGGPHSAVLPGRRRRLLQGHGRWHRLDPRRGQGPQHVDRVDRRHDRLWDQLTNLTFGSFDLLKILSSYPGLKASRDNRWTWLGLVNEPCFTKATAPDP